MRNPGNTYISEYGHTTKDKCYMQQKTNLEERTPKT